MKPIVYHPSPALYAQLIRPENSHKGLFGSVAVVGGHVGVARLDHQRAQPRVAVRITAAGLRRKRDVAREPGKYLAPARVSDRLQSFDLGPLVVTSHRSGKVAGSE